MAEEIIKDRPRSSVMKHQDNYEPDPSRFCEFIELSRISEKKAEIIHCENMADYRVKLYGVREYLIDGGDPSKETGDPEKSPDYRSQAGQEYLCSKHFNIKYKYSPQPTPKISFKRIKR